MLNGTVERLRLLLAAFREEPNNHGNRSLIGGRVPPEMHSAQGISRWT